MKKIYQKPDVELVTLVTVESIANDDIIDGDMGDVSNPF